MLLLLETVQTAALTHDTIQDLIIGFVNPNVFDVGTVWCSIPLITGLSTYMHVYVKIMSLLTKLVRHINWQLRALLRGFIAIESVCSQDQYMQ